MDYRWKNQNAAMKCQEPRIIPGSLNSPLHNIQIRLTPPKAFELIFFPSAARVGASSHLHEYCYK